MNEQAVEVESAQDLIAALGSTVGIKAVVAKQRHLYLLDGVRIHLDEVESLGKLIEFEAIAAPHSDLSAEMRQVESMRDVFALDEKDLIATSYCDLVAG